ncbi:unnamed protein product [Anisakis simplex]|uniref:G_PROTEIN_RECEP_F1_2 domain-containing protein n=1 Tax=Anisakis simplex TaxID=6269 RepID=A0A0M3JL61_ANISI|nr:unnamed protein product [Anisakis simplex]
MVFVKTIFLVVAWGLLHGLIVLPAFLGSLPKCLTDANCYRTFLSTSSQRSCRYVGTATSSTEHPSDALQVDDDDEAEVYEPHLTSV